MKHTVPVITDTQAQQTHCYTTCIRKVACQKQPKTKIVSGAGLGEHPNPKHFRNPYWVWRVAYPETTFKTKYGGVGAREEYQIFWDALLISATIEASNFKLGTQVGFGEYVKITALVPNVVGEG